MAIHKNYERYLIVSEGAVALPGTGSKKLAKGQLGVFPVGLGGDKDGVKAVDNFSGYPSTQKFQIKVGNVKESFNNISGNVINHVSFPFSIKDVLSLKESKPDFTGHQVDHLVFGYDGSDTSKSLRLKPGETINISIKLTGDVVGLLGYPGAAVEVNETIDAGSCDPYDVCVDKDGCAYIDCKPPVMEMLERLRRKELRGGYTFDNLFEIKPVFSCEDSVPPTTTPFDFWCMEVCDGGDENALAIVQSQYPDYEILRTERNGAFSKYKFGSDASVGAPADFVMTLPSLAKGCETCPTGYTEFPGGEVYFVQIEDEGGDLAGVVESLPNAIGGTAMKQGQNRGYGSYTVLLTQKLTETERADFIDSYPTVVLAYVGVSDAVCNNDSITTVSWEMCGSCNVSTETYTITLPDDKCGDFQPVLASLTEIYGDTVTYISSQNCQSTYEVTVPTNTVCEECEDIFLDYFRSEAPVDYNFTKWTKVEVPTAETNCLCGFHLKAIPVEMLPDECLRDKIAVLYDSARIEGAIGYVTEQREGVPFRTEEIPVKYFQRWAQTTHLGKDLFHMEDQMYAFFQGQFKGSCISERYFKGELSMIHPGKQYDIYTLSIGRDWQTQSFAQRGSYSPTNYNFIVESGKGDNVRNLLTKLAAASGTDNISAS